MSRLAGHTPEEDGISGIGAKSAPVTDLVDTLVARLSSSDGGERLAAREKLVQLGRPAVAPLLEVLADRRNHIRQWEAAKALTEIADPTMAPALVAALQDPSFDIRWLAAETLIVLQHAALRPLLQALIAHPESVWLREGAHHILCAFSDPFTHSLLAPVWAAIEDVEPELTIPPAAQKVLQQLGSVENP